MQIIKLLWGVCLIMALSACQTTKHYDDLHGPEPSLSSYGALVKADGNTISAVNEDAILKEYAKRAGILEEPFADSPRNWQLIVQGGLNAIDEQCETYMQAMFWAEREMRTARDDINLLGATTGTLMGVFGGPATAIATSAAAFGLATQTLTNESNGLFFEVEPSGVRRIVSRSQAAYRQAVDAKIATYSSRPAAVRAIQGYLTLCLPAHIATQINQAVDSSQFEVQDIKSSQINVIQKKPDEPSPRMDSMGENINSSQPLKPSGSIHPETSASNTTETQTKPKGCKDNECSLKTTKEVTQVQSALCLKPSGEFDDKTRAEIELFRQSNAVCNNAGKQNGLANCEIMFLQGKSSCDTKQFQNPYERFVYGVKENFDSTDLAKIEGLASALREAGTNPPDNPQDLNQLRPAIIQLQKKGGENETGQVTRQLFDLLQKFVQH